MCHDYYYSDDVATERGLFGCWTKEIEYRNIKSMCKRNGLEQQLRDTTEMGFWGLFEKTK